MNLLKGYFDIYKKKANGSVVEEYHFENLILDSGLNLIGTHFEAVTNYIALGSGNAEPNVSQTGLITEINNNLRDGGSTSAETWDLTSDVKSKSITKKFRINAGVATGNIAEIGLSPTQQKNSTLFCRALIKDNQGRPTTISKLADEILEIFYTLKIIIPHQDVKKQVMVKGELYDTITRPADMGVNSYSNSVIASGNIGAITHAPSSYIGSFQTQRKPYNSGSHKIGFQINLSDTDGNSSAGIRSTMFITLFGLRFQTEYRRVSDNAPIYKSNTETMTFHSEFSWGRA